MGSDSILSVKLDFLFKLLFGDERNVDILANFLSAVLNLPLEEFAELQLLNTILKKEHDEDKMSILDVNLCIKSGREIIIEMQVLNKKDYEKRSVFLTSKRLVEQLSEGEPYVKLKQIISINIIDFNLFPYEKYHSSYWLTEETEGHRLTEIYRIDFLELRKAANSPKEDMKKLWMDFFNAETKEDLTMLLEKSEVFQRPVAEVIRLSGDAAIRAEYDARQKELRDKQAELQYAWEQGEIKGEIKGAENKAIEVARNLLGKLDTATIANVTGLPLATILKLGEASSEE